MKKNIIVITLSLFLNVTSNAQVNLFHDAEAKYVTTSGSFIQKSCPYTKDSSTDKKLYYLEKSKRQKTGAWVLLGAGTALIATGFLIGNRDNSSFGEAEGGVVIGSMGVAACIGSIPLFISARKYKAKATLSISFQKTAPFVGKQISSMSLKIPFG